MNKVSKVMFSVVALSLQLCVVNAEVAQNGGLFSFRSAGESAYNAISAYCRSGYSFLADWVAYMRGTEEAPSVEVTSVKFIAMLPSVRSDLSRVHKFGLMRAAFKELDLKVRLKEAVDRLLEVRGRSDLADSYSVICDVNASPTYDCDLGDVYFRFSSMDFPVELRLEATAMVRFVRDMIDLYPVVNGTALEHWGEIYDFEGLHSEMKKAFFELNKITE